MPTVREIEACLFDLAPRAGAMDWDNVGLLIGDPEAPVQRILVALDITEAVADEAIARGAQVIVAHHPLINCAWKKVQTVREDTSQGSLLIKLIRSGIAAICMHTNLDVAKGGVNDALAHALELIEPGPLAEDGIGRIGYLKRSVPLSEFNAWIAERLHCGGLRYCDAGKEVFKVAVGGGACADYVEQAAAMGCDTFVTSDVSYHAFQNAYNQKINLIDAGHFSTENVICPVLVQHLEAHFPEAEIRQSDFHKEIFQYYIKGEF